MTVTFKLYDVFKVEYADVLTRIYYYGGRCLFAQPNCYTGECLYNICFGAGLDEIVSCLNFESIYGVIETCGNKIIAIKQHIGKLAFTVLALSSLGDLVVVTAKFLEGLFFRERAEEGYFFTYHLFILIVLAVVLPLIYLLVFKDIGSDPMYTDSKNGRAVKQPWRYLWLVPAVFFLITLQHYYEGKDWDLETFMDPISTLYLWAISAGSVLIFRVIAIAE